MKISGSSGCLTVNRRESLHTVSIGEKGEQTPVKRMTLFQPVVITDSWLGNLTWLSESESWEAMFTWEVSVPWESLKVVLMQSPILSWRSWGSAQREHYFFGRAFPVLICFDCTSQWRGDSVQTFLLGYLVPILQKVIGLLLHLPAHFPLWPMELLICPELNLSHWQILFPDSPSSCIASLYPSNARNRDGGVFYLPFSHSLHSGYHQTCPHKWLWKVP